MTEPISRRDLLKLGGLGLAAALLGPSNPENLDFTSLPERPIRKDQGAIFIMTPTETYKEDVKSFEYALNHRVHGLSFFCDLDNKQPDPALIESTLSSGRSIMFNLQPRPTEDEKDSEKRFSADRFLHGDHDPTLKNLGRMMASYKETIFVRYAFEMNGNWFSWGDDPESFIKIWRHTVNTFRESGATNVKWIFSPCYRPHPEKVGNFYPGDSYVDVVGADIYDWRDYSPKYAVNPINYYLRQAAPDKPLIIGELGAGEADRDEWLSEVITKSLKQGASGLNYFQYDKEKKWKIEDPNSIPRIRGLVESGIFLDNKADLETINRTILTVN